MIVGILGGGQLGRMLALAGYPLGVRARCLDPSADAPAGQITELLVGSYDDPERLQALADGADVVTYEFENVPARAAHFLAERMPVSPSPAALEAAQDRLAEKTLFRSLDIPTPRFAAVSSRPELHRVAAEIALPAVLKTRRLGYDGKGQAILRQPIDVEAAWNTAAFGGSSCILEQFVTFDRELSVVAVRGRDGEVRCYPPIENHHRDGILRRSLAPAPELTTELHRQAEDYATRIMVALGYVGVLAVELFQHNGRLLANEMAPRVHNSGHWTIEGAETSQFDNHLRATLGLPLGSTAARGHSAMLNLIGALPDPRAVLAVEGAHLHLYGKAPRPSRKLGHVTVTAASAGERDHRLSWLPHGAGLAEES